MPVIATDSLGSTIGRGNGANPEVYTTIAGVKGISGPEISVDFADVTQLDAVSGFEELLPTVKRTGEVTLAMVFDTTEHGNFNTDLTAGTPQSYQLNLNSPLGTVTFSGFVGALNNEIQVGAEIQADVTLRVSGPVTFA